MMDIQDREQSKLFQQMVDDCADLLSDLPQDQIDGLVRHFECQIDSRRTARYLIDARALLTCLIARYVLTPDNLLPLIVVAEMADKPDVKQAVDRFRNTSSSVRIMDEGNRLSKLKKFYAKI